jgi:hypothetical protein
MKFIAVILFAAGAALLLRGADERVVSPLPGGMQELTTTGFTTEEYYDPPNEQKLKLRFSGASVAPLPGGLQAVSEMRIEYFSTNGVTRMRAQAPQCEMSPFDQVATSTNRLELASGDGKLRTDGVGFTWQQTNMTLVITNVHTVLKTGTNSIFKL